MAARGVPGRVLAGRRFIAHSLHKKVISMMVVCMRFLGISFDVARSRNGGAFAELLPLSLCGNDQSDAQWVRPILELYGDHIVANIVSRVNRWRSEKQSGPPPSDLFLARDVCRVCQ